LQFRVESHNYQSSRIKKVNVPSVNPVLSRDGQNTLILVGRACLESGSEYREHNEQARPYANKDFSSSLSCRLVFSFCEAREEVHHLRICFIHAISGLATTCYRGQIKKIGPRTFRHRELNLGLRHLMGILYQAREALYCTPSSLPTKVSMRLELC
jgi:hypothetical protein